MVPTPAGPAAHPSGPGGRDGGPAGRVVLLTREGCHLCDDAREVVARECAAAGEPFRELDVDLDEALRRTWTDRVPVVWVDGDVVDFWRVDPDRLRDRLAGSRPGLRGLGRRRRGRSS